MKHADVRVHTHTLYACRFGIPNETKTSIERQQKEEKSNSFCVCNTFFAGRWWSFGVFSWNNENLRGKSTNNT